MGLDIRLPIGMLFGMVGALLAAFGALSSRAIYQRSLGVNVNLLWGIVLLIFGAAMLVLGWRGARAGRPPGEKSD
ncbi:MAG: hypothetical protein HYR57_04095 [Candidatus Koribacter versatilis]|nr:hypothetical protein [Candidatus Koribacter versatilis]